MNIGAATILMNCMMHGRLKAGRDFEIKEKMHFKMVGDSDLMAAQVDMTGIDGHVVLVGVVSSRAKVERSSPSPALRMV
jgi:osmotically-inducible protein OsmY